MAQIWLTLYVNDLLLFFVRRCPTYYLIDEIEMAGRWKGFLQSRIKCP